MKNYLTIIFFIILTFAFIAMSSQIVYSQPSPPCTGGVCNSLATYFPMPDFSQEEKKIKTPVAISVKISIDEKGNVTTAKACSGHPLLRTKAEKAALKAKFRVTKLSGTPVKVNCILVYNFNPPESDLVVTAEFPQAIIKLIPKPEYPESARFVNAFGEVSVEVVVDRAGNVESAKAISGHPLLRSASEKAALQAKFKPLTLSGKPVKVRTYLIYKFVSDRIIETAVSNEELILGNAETLPKPPFPSFSGKVGTNRPQVLVQVEIDENGNVISAKAISGHPVLRAACEVAARSSKFSQTKISGIPVKAKAILLYEFNLDKDSKTVEVQSIQAINPNSESKL